jgi:hypothetical protein
LSALASTIPRVLRLPLRFGLLALSACSSSVSGTIQIVIGDESDTFSRPPAVVELQVDSVDFSGSVKTLAIAPLPASTVDLGSVAKNAVGTLQVTGTDATGRRIVYGQSLPIAFGALAGMTVPVFVQRTGELARLPRPLSGVRAAPTVAAFAQRYLFVGAGGDPSLLHTTQLYDFAYFAPLAAPPSLPRAPQSIAFVGIVGLLIDDGGATAFDFSQNVFSDVTAPAGGSFRDVAGGATVFASDGSQYIVGATRTQGAPTATVLALDPLGKRSWRLLGAPRLGASATWVDGRGLVVAGGSASAAGVEVVGIGSMSGSALAYPPDASTGIGATTLDAQHVLLAGGVTPTGQDAGVRVIDLGCAAQCSPTVWSALPVPLGSTQTFASDAANALVVGSELAGTTHVYRLATGMVTEVPTRVPHVQARAVVSPLGSVVLFGGSSEIESFVP